MNAITKRPLADARAPAHLVDQHVGGQIKARRRSIGMSQTDLADHIGVTFQQIQKYERGANRVSASKLYEISQALKVTVASFFGDLDGQAMAGPARFDSEPMTLPATQDAMTLLEAWPGLRPEVRKAILDMVQVISRTDGPEGDTPARGRL